MSELFSGGLSNYLYYCALPTSVERHVDNTVASNDEATGHGALHIRGSNSSSSTSSLEPREVLLRIYGQVQGEQVDIQSLVAESVIFTVLSERKLGPKLYGVFPGGRLEEYIPVRLRLPLLVCRCDIVHVSSSSVRLCMWYNKRVLSHLLPPSVSVSAVLGTAEPRRQRTHRRTDGRHARAPSAAVQGADVDLGDHAEMVVCHQTGRLVQVVVSA